MIFRIPKGKHRALPLRLGLWWRRPVFAWTVCFDENCRYNLESVDQGDYNKLIGIGYLPRHHTDSARFGWRYWPDTKNVELAAYCYVDKRRVKYHICDVEIGKEYRIQLHITKLTYMFNVTSIDEEKVLGGCSIAHFHSKKLQYRLDPWFGGNKSAPHEMTIQIEKA